MKVDAIPHVSAADEATYATTLNSIFRRMGDRQVEIPGTQANAIAADGAQLWLLAGEELARVHHAANAVEVVVAHAVERGGAPSGRLTLADSIAVSDSYVYWTTSAAAWPNKTILRIRKR